MSDTLTISMPATLEIQHFKRAERWQWLSTRRLLRDTVTLAGLLPLDCAGILGIPRSGLLPAAAIATQLHLPLYVLEDSTVRRCRAERGRTQEVHGRGNRLVVVDDSIYSGNGMAMVRAGLVELEKKQPVLYATVYASPETSHLVDLHAETVEWPFLAEWNLINNRGWGNVLAFDLDGVIVHDEESGGRPGSPYMVPRAYTVPLIATGRPESMREATEQQLRQLGVRWQRLEMMPGHVMNGRGVISQFKTKVYQESDCQLFIESDPNQAAHIAHYSGKAAACPRHESVFGISPMPEGPFAK